MQDNGEYAGKFSQYQFLFQNYSEILLSSIANIQDYSFSILLTFLEKQRLRPTTIGGQVIKVIGVVVRFIKMPLQIFIIIMGKKLGRIGKIPAFIKKLVQILDDLNVVEIICWLPEGNGFQILNNTAFTEKVLAKHFKHQNMASFIRQLNMYGFNRSKDLGQNVYMHPRFQKGNLNNMKFIKRKIAQAKQALQENKHQKSKTMVPEESNSRKFLMEQYQKIYLQNQQLKKQNQQLLLKLSQFQQIKQKIKQYTEQMQKFIAQPTPDSANENNNFTYNQNDRQQKQANKSNTSSENTNQSSTSSSDFEIRKGFKICDRVPRSNHQSSYQILLQGAKVELGKK